MKLQLLKVAFSIVLMIFFLHVSAQNDDLKKINLVKHEYQAEYKYSNGARAGSRKMFKYYYQYEGESQWNDVGKRGERISYELNSFSSSSKAYKQSVNWGTYGSGSSYGVTAIGSILVVSGLIKKYDDNGIEINPSARKMRLFTGIGLFTTGYVFILTSNKLTTKKFEEAVDLYNQELDESSSYLHNNLSRKMTFSTGISFNNSVQLSFTLKL